MKKIVRSLLLFCLLGSPVIQAQEITESRKTRYAYSSDGYNQDRDDVAGSAMALALFDRAGIADQIVHFHFNTNFGGAPTHAQEHRRSVLETAVLFGIIDEVDGDDAFFDVSRSPEEKEAAIVHLAEEMSLATIKERLIVICAGGVQVPYAALQRAIREGASPEALGSITFFSHAEANEQTCRKDHKDYRYNWDDLKKVSPHPQFIDYNSPLSNGRRDGGVNLSQNSTAWNQAPRSHREGVIPWEWLEEYGDQIKGFGFSGTKGEWLLEHLKAAGKPELGLNGNAEGDASDAGMVFALLPGGRTDATMEEIRAYFLGKPKTNEFDPAFAHTVYFWLKDPESSSDRQKFVVSLRKFMNNSKYAKTCFIGIPPSASRDVVDGSFTYSLIVTFESAEAQQKYQEEEAHTIFIEESGDLWSKVIVYDSEEILK